MAEYERTLSYNPETGLFTRKIDGGGGVKAGSIAGTTTKKGYIQIRLADIDIYAHKLAFRIMEGRWPAPGMEVHHKDKVRNHNWWANLEERTKPDNLADREWKGKRRSK
jgi:hypothetical protein